MTGFDSLNLKIPLFQAILIFVSCSKFLTVELSMISFTTPRPEPSFVTKMSRDVRKPTFWFPTWSDTNQAVHLQKMARGLKFQI